MDTDKEVRELAEKRAEYDRAKVLSKSTKASLDDLSALIAEGQLKSLPIIIKADVQGSLEAIKGSLEKLRNEEVKVNIIHEGVGGVTESDLTLADASEHAVVLGFNVSPTGAVKKKAKELGIEIRSYSIIYDLLDDVKALLGGMMSPVISEEVTGQADVRETFVVGKVGTIAGCKVSDGAITRNSKARLIRDGVVVYESTISSLKRFNEDAKEVKNGFECGIMLENFNDIKEGDVIETFKDVEEQVTMDKMTQEEIKRHSVESVLKEIIPEAFASLNDERIKSLAVTDVKCSKGRSNAKVYLDKSFLNEKEQGEALRQLRKVGAYLQNHCKQSEGWFKAPIFTFEFDHQLEKVSRIEDLFKQIEGRNSKKEDNQDES